MRLLLWVPLLHPSSCVRAAGRPSSFGGGPFICDVGAGVFLRGGWYGKSLMRRSDGRLVVTASPIILLHPSGPGRPGYPDSNDVAAGILIYLGVHHSRAAGPCDDCGGGPAVADEADISSTQLWAGSTTIQSTTRSRRRRLRREQTAPFCRPSRVTSFTKGPP